MELNSIYTEANQAPQMCLNNKRTTHTFTEVETVSLQSSEESKNEHRVSKCESDRKTPKKPYPTEK